MALNQNGLVAQLRRRIMDERVGRTSFRLSCTDEAASDCLVAISAASVFTTTAYNARKAQNLSFDLTTFPTDTVKGLVEALQAAPGYEVICEQDFDPQHPAEDLSVVGSMSILGEATSFRHHLFSDSELLEVLDSACKRHNVAYTPETVPENEYVFVLMLAHSEACRRLASDSAKRRNLEQSAEQLLEVARDLEDSYSRDTRRQQRAIPVPKVDEEDIKQGDIVIGTISRRSLRSGLFTPMANDGLVSAAVLEEPNPDLDIEDIKIRLRWKRNTNLRFHAYELWRDTQPNVERPSVISADANRLQRDQIKQPYTSCLVFRSLSSNASSGNVGWAASSAQSGQLITTYVDSAAPAGSSDGGTPAPPLEPSTTYYYRLFIISLNNEVYGSNVVGLKTKSMRALLSAPPLAVAPAVGPAGTEVTFKGTNFHTGMTITLGGKPVTLTVVDAQTATGQVPTFYNPAAADSLYDVVLTSSNGLRDVLLQGFKYTVPS